LIACAWKKYSIKTSKLLFILHITTAMELSYTISVTVIFSQIIVDTVLNLNGYEISDVPVVQLPINT